MKIDYEITVNVFNLTLTHEEKKRIQDAFFKLGITWRDVAGYTCLDKSCYTNKLKTGEVTKDLMWAFEGTEPTHTVDELLELAGMKTKTDLKPFDLEKALAGEPVVLRNGKKAFVRYHETQLKTDFPLTGYVVDEEIGNTVISWNGEGSLFTNANILDIVGMWYEPPVFNHWDLLAESIKYLAKDANGRWYGYSGKPSKDEREWNAPLYKGYCSLSAINPTLFPDCDWENSLMERPENE